MAVEETWRGLWERLEEEAECWPTGEYRASGRGRGYRGARGQRGGRWRTRRGRAVTSADQLFAEVNTESIVDERQ